MKEYNKVNKVIIYKVTLDPHIIYIMPACDLCNKPSTRFDLKDGIKFNSVNIEKTYE